MDNVEKYLSKYIDNNTKGKRITKNKKIIIICVIILLIIFNITVNPLKKVKENLYKSYEDYRVERAIKIEKRDQQKHNMKQKQKTYSTRYMPPISGSITSSYGYRNDPITGKYSKHTGIDISGKHRDSVTSIADGVVTYAGVQRGYGNCVEIRHDTKKDGTIYSFYAHLSKIKVNMWDSVNEGQTIGIEGGGATDPNRGNSTGHHLHFEIRTASGYGHDINPYNYIF
ncbi:MAG: M23 family metallopeptidase [Clostridia bacterium]